MSSRPWLWAALAVVLIQAVPANHKTPLEIDEQVTFYIAHGRTPGSVWKRAFEQSATPPLYFWLANASGRAGKAIDLGSREFWLRLPSLASYLGAVWLAWRIARRELGASAGAAAAVMLALHGVGIEKMALQARPYALCLALTLVALDSLLTLRRGCWCSSDASLLGLALTGLCWAHYLCAVLWVPAMLQAAFAREYAPFRGRLFGALILAALWCVPLLPGALRVGAIGPALSWITEAPSWQPLDALLAPMGVLCGLATSLAIRSTSGRLGRPAAPTWLMREALVWLVVWTVLPLAVLQAAAAWLGHPTLAQLRYALPTLGPFVLLVAGVLAVAARGRFVLLAALAYSLAAGHVGQAQRRLSRPVWHDSEWKEAAELLKQQAGPADLVFVYSGLVETNLTPARFEDAGFQEYATSRLSGFYGGDAFPRLALPALFPGDGMDCVRTYTRRVDAVRTANGAVWLVVSADTDLGERCQQGFERWMTSLGFDVHLARPNSVARVLRCAPSG